MPLCLIKGVPFVVVDHSDISIISGLVFDKKNMIHIQNRFNHKTEKKGWTNKTSYLHST